MPKFSSFTRQVTKFAAGSALSQITVAASIPILARLYDPTVLGNFLLFDAYCDVLAFGSTLALDKALYSTRSSNSARSLIVATLISITLVSLLAGGLLGLAIALGLVPDGLSHFWLIIPCLLVVWARGAYYLFQSLSIRASRFGEVVLAENLRAIVIIIGRFGFGLLGFGIAGLVATAAISASASVVVVARKSRTLLREALQAKHIGLFQRVLVTHKERIIFEGGGQFLRQFPMRGPIFAIAIYFTVAGAGFYSIALLLTYRPAELVVRSVSEVFRARIAENIRGGHTTEARRQSTILITRTFVAAPIATFAAGLFIYLTEGILFPENWQGVGSVALYNSLYVSGLMMLRPVQIIFSLYQKQKLAFLLEFGAVIACFGGIFLGGELGFSLEAVCLTAGAMLCIVLLPLTYKALTVVRD